MSKTGRMAPALALTMALCLGAGAQNIEPKKPQARPRTQAADETVSSVNLTSSMSSPPLGDTVTLTATVPSAADTAAPTGTVSFYSTPNPLSLSAGATSPHASLQQGWATDGVYIYSIDTASFSKRNNDSTWSVADTNTSPFTGLTAGITHLGDGEYYNGNLYIPAENWAYNGSCTYRYQTLAVYDTTSPGMPLVASNDISGDGHEVSGIAVVPSQNALYVASYCDGSQLWIYDISTLTLTGTLPLSENIKAIQGVSYSAATNTLFISADAFTSGNKQFGGNLYQVSLSGAVEQVFAVPGPGELEGLDYTSPDTGVGYVIDDHVDFQNGGPLALGMATLGAGSASLTTGAIQTGNDTVTAVYNGDATYAPATSNGVAETITRLTPGMTVTASATSISTAQSLSMTATVTASSGGPAPTGSIVLTCGSYTSAPVTLSGGTATVIAPPWSLAGGNDAVVVTYIADTASAPTYNSVAVTTAVTVTEVIPTVSVVPSSSSLTTVQSFTLAINVGAGPGSPSATGTVIVSSGAYSSAKVQMDHGAASITVPAETLAVGDDTLTVNYAPGVASAPYYSASTGTAAVAVSLATPMITATASPTSITPTEGLTVTIAVNGGSGNPTPTGAVALTSGSYSSGAVPLNGGAATIAIAAGTLPPGNDTLTAAYTPDPASSTIYAAASQTLPVMATGSGTATMTINTSASTITNEETLSVSVSLAGADGQPVPTGAVILSSGNYSAQMALSAGGANFVIPAGALSGGANTLTASYLGDQNYAPSVSNASVNVAPLAISISRPSAIAPGGSATATATLSASTGFSGTMNLSCSLSSAPTGALSLPTCSLNPATLAFTNGGIQAVIVTVSTAASSSNALSLKHPQGLWPMGGGGALAAGLALLGLPARRRRVLGMLALLIAVLAAGASGCGGSSDGAPGTSAGNYIFTVTGTTTGTTPASISATVTVVVE